MNLYVHYKKTGEDKVTSSIQLHKNNKGYNVQIEGKFYFPKYDNPVIRNIDKEEKKKRELWVVVTKDEINYGNISFAVPDYFVRVNESKKSVFIEKEVPLNQLDNPDEPFIWDYLNIAECNSVDQTDEFIENCENLRVPEQIVMEAIKTFYSLQN